MHNLRHEFTCAFVIANTTIPHLGYNFLNHFSLTVGSTNNRLMNITTNRQSKTQGRLLRLWTYVRSDSKARKIIEKYPNIISPHCDPNTKKKWTFFIRSRLCLNDDSFRYSKVRKPLEGSYTGPFEVLRSNQKYFTIKISNEVKCSLNWLNKACIKFRYQDILLNINQNFASLV